MCMVGFSHESIADRVSALIWLGNNSLSPMFSRLLSAATMAWVAVSTARCSLAFLLAMLTHYPLTLTVNLEPSGVDDQVCHWPLVRSPVVDFHRLGPLADAAKIGGESADRPPV